MSIDSVFALTAFREKLQLPFHLISDANREVSRSLNILLDEVAGIREVASRSVVLIEPDGRIKWRYGGDLTIPDIDDVKKEIDKLIP
ncbi:MAG: redoxin domain-containing protein [Bacillaceae bacterium]|nr:redoxin domain-containing protein [Bacillaceae bacterium]